MKTFLVPLSPEEEADCLKRWQSGEQTAKEELILHNMRLVAHVAKKYVSSGEDAEDLISIGTIGLLKAADSFNRIMEVDSQRMRYGASIMRC